MKGADWQTLGQLLEGDTGAKRTTASLHALEIDKPFAADGDMAFPKEHKVATRLGAEDHLVEFDPPLTGPFGVLVRHLPLGPHLWPKGVDKDTLPSHAVALDGGIEFDIGPAQFRYGPLGLERKTTPGK